MYRSSLLGFSFLRAQDGCWANKGTITILYMKICDCKSLPFRLEEYSKLVAAAAKINGKDLNSEQEMELRGGSQEVEGDAGEEVGDCV